MSIETVFSDDVIELFDIGAAQFHHDYTQRTDVDLQRVVSLAEELSVKHGKRAVAYHTDPQFESVLHELKLDSYEPNLITLPWWNEVAAAELAKPERTKTGVVAHLSDRHSYETQLIRRGAPLPIRSASVGSIVRTLPDRKSETGYVAIGLRGGKSFPNTYHINAGALTLTPELKEGSNSIYDVLLREELTAEFNVTENDITKATFLSRIDDLVIEQGPTYVFDIATNLSTAELVNRFYLNPHVDKEEHTSLIFIPNSRVAVREFIANHYRGHARDDANRLHDERVLLHPGALALASSVGLPAQELERFYQEGQH